MVRSSSDSSERAVDIKYECIHKEGSLNKFCRHYSIYQRARQGKKEKAIHPALVYKGWMNRHG